jgi:apolipoprotein N-acyltransferase
MLQTSAFIGLVVGATLIGIVTRVAIAPATWLALPLVVHASRSLPVLPSLAYVWVALYVALAMGNRAIIPVTGPPYFVIVAFVATTAAFPFAVDRLAASAIAGYGSTLVFPAAWVAAEFLRSRFTPSATFGSLAYTQYGFAPLMQVAAFVGIWGITFVIAWFASTVEWAWSRGCAWNVVRAPLLTYAATLGAMVLSGSVRLALAPTDRASIRIAALNRPVDLFQTGELTRIAEGALTPAERRRVTGTLTRLHDWFLDGSRREARAGARLIVWPETNLLIFKEDEPAFLERARRLAADEGVYLAMGMGTVQPGVALPLENKVILIDPSGRTAGSYLKSHAVAGWEAGIMKVGDGRVPVTATSVGRIATAICFDADFPEFIRQAGQGAADLLILPANDWQAIKSMHAEMAAFRAIENGVPLVRPASAGVSTAFDPWGRVLGVADSFAAGDGTLIVQMPMGRVSTLYSLTGDLFAWLCVAAVVVVLAIAAAAPLLRHASRPS